MTALYFASGNSASCAALGASYGALVAVAELVDFVVVCRSESASRSSAARMPLSSR